MLEPRFAICKHYQVTILESTDVRPEIIIYMLPETLSAFFIMLWDSHVQPCSKYMLTFLYFYMLCHFASQDGNDWDNAPEENKKYAPKGANLPP